MTLLCHATDALATGALPLAFTGPIPADPLFADQWPRTHPTGGITLRRAGTEFTGRGVRGAVVDDGFDHRHPDLALRYDTRLDRDWRDNDFDSLNSAGERHGTAVTGVIAAALDGQGAVGVAHGATLAGLRIGSGTAGSAAQYAKALVDGARFDFVNCCWGYGNFFSDNFASPTFFARYGGGDWASVNGTSFAAPIVSGVVTLMLEANRALGWRDVQELLAHSACPHSARPTDTANRSRVTNGAVGWTDGGLATAPTAAPSA